MTDAIALGPVVLPPSVLAIAVGAITARVTVFLVSRREGDRSRAHAAWETLVNAFILAFIAWKVYPIFPWWDAIVSDPIRLLRLPGGRAGVLIGVAVAALVVGRAVWRDRTTARPLAMLAFAAGIGSVITLGAVDAASTPTTEFLDHRQLTVAPLDNPNTRVSVLSEEQPTVVTFWATWCGPCRAEIPVKRAAHTRFNGEATFAAVNMTHTESGPGAVRRFVEAEEIDYPVYLDAGGEASRALAVRGTPTTVVVDADGRVVARWMGPSSLDRIERAIAEAKK